MKRLLPPLIFTLLFLTTFFLPVLHFSFGKDLNGFEAFIFNFTRLFLVQDFVEYVKVVSTVLTSFFVLVLLVWSYRQHVKLIPTILVGSFVLITGFSWVFKYSGQGVLMYGYWIWLGYMCALIIYNITRTQKVKA
jgi:flagellar biosynthesis protein FlhB